MSLPKSFREAVKEGNIRKVRIIMEDNLLADLTFAGFDEMERAASNLNGLYDEHDGQEFVLDSSKWDDNYMNKLMVDAVLNFSHERIDHLKKVVRYLRPVEKQVTSKNLKKGSTYQEEKHFCQESGEYLGAKIAVGACAGAVVGGVAASIAGVTVIGSAAVGAAVGGIVTCIITKGGDKA